MQSIFIRADKAETLLATFHFMILSAHQPHLPLVRTSHCSRALGLAQIQCDLSRDEVTSTR